MGDGSRKGWHALAGRTCYRVSRSWGGWCGLERDGCAYAVVRWLGWGWTAADGNDDDDDDDDDDGRLVTWTARKAQMRVAWGKRRR
jgi:hypothetical protein